MPRKKSSNPTPSPDDNSDSNSTNQQNKRVRKPRQSVSPNNDLVPIVSDSTNDDELKLVDKNNNETKQTAKSVLDEINDFAQDGIQILIEIAQSDHAKPEAKISAIRTLWVILKNSKVNEEPKPKRENWQIEITEQQELLFEAQEYIKAKKELVSMEASLVDDLHLLPYSHPLYEPEPSPEIRAYRRFWRSHHPTKPYPKTEDDLKLFYKDWCKKRGIEDFDLI